MAVFSVVTWCPIAECQIIRLHGWMGGGFLDVDLTIVCFGGLSFIVIISDSILYT
jgi:hypothetical protein